MSKRVITLLPLLAVAAPAAGLAAQQAHFPPAERPAWIGVSYDLRWIQGDGRCEPQVLVERVVQGSPADRAGLRSGDAIVALDGQPLPGARLHAFATRLSPGDSVRLRVSRDGRVREVLAVADRRPPQPPAAVMDPAPAAPASPAAPIVANAPIVHLDGTTLVARNVEGAPRRIRGYWLATGDGRTEYRSLAGSWSRDDTDARVLQLLECADEVEWQPASAPRVDLRQVQKRADSLRVVIARRAMEREDLERLVAGHAPVPAGHAPVPAASRGVAGAELTALEPELAEYFRNARQGLLVLRVAQATPAARGGLLPGDVIVQANGRRVDALVELRALLDVPDPQPVQLRVVRKGRLRSITLPRP